MAGCFSVCGTLAVFAQSVIYDSHVEPPPHVFGWTNRYDAVEFWEDARAEIDGGFLGSVRFNESSSGRISSGQFTALKAIDDASVLVLSVTCELITARHRAKIDVYGAEQTIFGDVWAMEDGVIRLFGGSFGEVYSLAKGEGRIEVAGGAHVKNLSSSIRALAIQRGGETERFDATASGISLLSEGAVTGLMSASETGTIILAGGEPAADIRLFENGRLMILHTEDSRPEHESYALPDFDEPGATPNFAGKNLSVNLNGEFRDLVVSVWSSDFLEHLTWNGRVELLKLNYNLKMVAVNEENILVAFQASVDEILQFEMSTDLASWESMGAPFPGNGKVRAELVRRKDRGQLFFRLRRWPKPQT